jgi:Protein of unknown function (DUF4229)
MRITVAYTSARIVLFLFALLLLRLAGLGGLLLWGLAFLISALVSYVLLSRQRDAMSASLAGRLRGRQERRRAKGSKPRVSWRARLEAGAGVEDEDPVMPANRPR